MSNATEASREEKLLEKMTESVNALNVNFARVEGKIDSALELKNDVASLRKQVDATDDIAKEAQQRSTETEKRLDRFETSVKWGFGVVVTVVLPIAMWVLNMIVK